MGKAEMFDRTLKELLFFFIMTLTIVLNPDFAWSDQSDSQRRVIFVVCDYLLPEEIQLADLPNLREFFEKGGVALLNTNTAGARNRQNAAATISSGNTALCTPAEPLAFGAGESYRNEDPFLIFQARTGITPRPENVVVLDLPYIQWANIKDEITAEPGTLGDSLHEAGLKTAVVGNADVPGKSMPQRAAAVIAMDRRGIIDAGDVSEEILLEDPRDPLGYRLDYDAVKKRIISLMQHHHFIVIELGDLVRLEQTSQYLSPAVYHQEREKILREYDAFIGWLMKEVDLNSSQVYITSTTPNAQAVSQKRLFGFIAVRGEGTATGLLTTPTTRRPGIVTLCDIAPSIASYLGASLDSSSIGRPWRVEPVSDNTAEMLEIEKRTVFASLLRPSLVRGYVVLHLLVLAGLLFFMLFDPRKVVHLTPFLLGLIAAPLALLLVGFFPITNIWLYLCLFLLLDVLLAVLSICLAGNKDFDPLIILCLATVGVLLLDTVTGGELQRYSVLSYDPMAGARYYGIGNEYMGILLGATIIGHALLLQRLRDYPLWPRVLVGLFFLLVLLVLGLPQWGSNFGGSLAAAIAFSYTYFRLLGIRLRLREVCIGFLLAGLFGGGVLLVDFLRPPEGRSHFGQFIFSLHADGAEAFRSMVIRKLSMNYKLIRYTIWTRVLLGTLLTLGILFYRPVGIFRRLLTENPAVAAGLSGGLIAAFAALVFNDSGIVAAATAMICPAATLFYIVIREQEASL
ncbi:alkaline-phosphatase-like protein [Thermacetogenium phaeum DSM 12270]|uniref:Alkaline-phosphatase-like protein n=1 Tax=Thermacetogenium phaeum (strain ATCC BAA-254 / DSM 26808 / PB) TaxID=1089553 RepID=K4LFF6_THEPS|nr:hypothetical protein [Thermacetogenium phaeum]AFV11756.1 alkaline-phosphatase-like protein [Thermacetogenium phaeum DSM 12270]